ncbi:type 1 glutamine amidotransferase [Amantichitinum ursilacus]|uniref:GMP synthase [glutamine-hydrolyzing] n=1 Tax=Amantichitinum ursilacus TaxID=857265 RepID=A0A0N0GL88_9NEIS|nr:type 1 glutamine amidotransferase [Amantichitinum ursilacus]KPC49706.1 GMP synthase [glutamine-hydrolyzing] [Amantichitinum ursilacus]
MKPHPSPWPALVIQFSPDDGAAFLGQWLTQHGQPWQLIDTSRGDVIPALTGFGGVALLGGTMSAYDDFPARAPVEALIRAAVAQDVPVLGHCLGGQLLAQALGGTVARGPQPEIGWHPVDFNGHPLGHHWFGTPQHPTLMHWHYDALTPPPGSTLLARSSQCACQAFAMGNLHLGMQFHIEVDRAKVELWLIGCAAEVEAQQHIGSVQTLAEIRAHIERHLAASQALAAHIYTRWLHQFRRAHATWQQASTQHG